MRQFKTDEELRHEKQVELGLVPFKMPTHKIILLYARQSTRGQALKNKESALQQTEEQLMRAQELGWPEDKRLLFIENQAKDGRIRSASGRLRIDEREGLSTVMLYINNDEASAVMARDVARLFRDEDLVGPVVFAKTCKEHHVLVITEDYIYNFNDPKRGRDDYKKFIQEAQAAADYLEKHQKGVMLKNLERKALRGEYHGGVVPTGFMLDEERKFYVPNPIHAEPITHIFKRYRALGGNLSILRQEVAGRILFKELPPDIQARVGKIHLTPVQEGWTIKTRGALIWILTNPAYIGHVYYKGRIVKYNAHPAIVDEEDFWYAYHRLAHQDFDGNPIEHPDGVTKRYQQAKTKGTRRGGLLDGLRNDGTPLITGPQEKVHVYIDMNSRYDTGFYKIHDYSQLAYSFVAGISVKTLDQFVSERLLYRIGETLQKVEEYPEDSQAQWIEETRTAVHLQLAEKVERVQADDQQQNDPHQALRDSIAETQVKIAEKERHIDTAGPVMSNYDLKRNYEALARLRANLSEMENKLKWLAEEVQKQEKVREELPGIYHHWHSMTLEGRQRSIRMTTANITFASMGSRWFRLTIEWSPAMGIGTIKDVAIIWAPYGGDRWTEEEKGILDEHYLTASKEKLLELLPERCWNAIWKKGERISHRGRDCMNPRKRELPANRFSHNEWAFLYEHELPADQIVHNEIYWREYVEVPYLDELATNANRDHPPWPAMCQW